MESWKTRRLRTQKRSMLLYTAKGQSKVLIESHTSPVLSCEFHKSGRFVASSNSAGRIYIFPAYSSTEKLAYLKGHTDAVTEVHYSTDGLDLYSASKDGCISAWDAFLGVRKFVMNAHDSGVNTVQCSRTSKPILCSGSSDKTIRVWDLREGCGRAMFKSEHEVVATCFSFNNEYIYSGGFNSGDITVWDSRQNNISHVLAGHTDSVTGLSLSPCGKYLASCSVDGTLRRWDLSSRMEIQSFYLDQGDLTHLRRCAWSPDGTQLAAGTSGSQVVVYDTNNNERLFDGHSEEVFDVSFHPKLDVLCSAGADRKLVIHCM